MRVTTVLMTFLLITTSSFAVCANAKSLCAPAVLSDIQIAEETTGYSIDIKYPVLCATKANQTLREYVTTSLAAFKMFFPEHDLSDYPHKHQMMTEHTVWSAGKGRLASVELREMVFTGGAHPNTSPITWVFDLTDGKALTLDDIFIDTNEALIEVAPLVRELLINTLGYMHVPRMLNDGTTPTTINYGNFILDEEGIAFIFAPYQVAPYAAGQQMVTIPYERVATFLRPEIKEIL